MHRWHLRSIAVIGSTAAVVVCSGQVATAAPADGLTDQGAVAATSKASADASAPGGVGVSSNGVAIPASGAASVVLTSPTGATTSVTASDSERSRIVGDAAVADVAGAKIVSQAVAPGIAMHAIAIGDAAGPRSYAFDVVGPAGQSPTLRDDGSVALVASSDGVDVQTGSIAAPWAVAADGSRVPTRFAVAGSTVTQSVDATAATSFPVVADPRITFGRSVQIMLTGFEANAVRRVAAAVLGVGVKIGCSAPARAAVAAVGGPASAVAGAVLSLGCKYGEAALVSKLFGAAQQHGPYVDAQCYAAELLHAIGGGLSQVDSTRCSGANS